MTSRPNTPLGVIITLTAIGAGVLVAVGIFAAAGGVFAPTRLPQRPMVAALHDAGVGDGGFRLNHARGICVSGMFESNGQAVPLSKAALFAVGQVLVIGRLSLAGGLPFQADNPATVRALALRFLPQGGEEWRIGTVNIPVFIVNSAQGFHDQTVATAADPGTGKPDPAKMHAFLALHPETVKALAIIKATPVSSGFADATYYGLDAFRFVNAAGDSVPVRWSLVPIEPFLPENPVQSRSKDKDYLFEALISQVSAHPLQWHLLVTIGQPGDPTDDATRPWPSARTVIDAGTVRIDQVASEAKGRCTDVNYDPTVLPSGIEASDDPLLRARSAAYARSFTLRAERYREKPPSEVLPPEVLTAAQ